MANAQVDNTFNSGGSGANTTINCIALQADGKMIIAGNFAQYNGVARNRIVRINSNGTLDNTFNIGSGASAAIYSLAIQADGKVLVGGSFTQFNGLARNRIVRLTSTGAIDNTFNIGSGASDAVRAIAVQSDGKVILGGSFAQYNGVAKGKIVRVSSTGSIDTGFNSGGAGANAASAVYALALQSDGKVIVGGSFTQFNTAAKGRILRLTTSGAIDATFNSGGAGANSDVRCLRVQADGKILVGGLFVQFNTSTKGRILRLTTSGSIDSGFNSGGSGASDAVYAIAQQSNNKIILVGNFTQFNTSAKTRIVRLTTSGAVDNTLNASTGASSAVNGIVRQSNGGLVVVGSFAQFGSLAVGRIARLTNSTQMVLDDDPIEIAREKVRSGQSGSVTVRSTAIGLVLISDTERTASMKIYSLNGSLLHAIESVRLPLGELAVPMPISVNGLCIVTLTAGKEAWVHKVFLGLN
ncbi:MAG: hypothetical protein IPL52_01605 [Flavobacteriales bacterium]|nr:hypothetical protein [Flavobacteriales bacterium]